MSIERLEETNKELHKTLAELENFNRKYQMCVCCGAYKDPIVKEAYPYGDEDGIIDDPIEPFMEIAVDQDKGGASKAAFVCHECYHKIQPDMWIMEEHWIGFKPVVPFDKLPDR